MERVIWRFDPLMLGFAAGTKPDLLALRRPRRQTRLQRRLRHPPRPKDLLHLRQLGAVGVEFLACAKIVPYDTNKMFSDIALD